MRIIVSAIIMVLISGCIRTVTQDEIKAARKFCANNDGIYSYEVTIDVFVDYINCKDGTNADMNEVRENNKDKK